MGDVPRFISQERLKPFLPERYPISWRTSLGVQGLRSQALEVLRSPHQSGTYDLKLQAWLQTIPPLAYLHITRLSLASTFCLPIVLPRSTVPSF